jgi:hypothetical protein
MDLTLYNETNNNIQQVTITNLDELPDLIQVYFNIEQYKQIIKYNENIIDITKPIENYNICNGDLICVQMKNDFQEDTDMNDNQLDEHMENMMMESQISHSSIYIRGQYSDHAFRILVDSGAQPNVISYEMARFLGLENLIDKRMSGLAKGVGTTKIYGCIYGCNIKIGDNLNIPVNFKVMDNDLDKYLVILGLDFLYPYGCVMDFKNRLLQVNNNNIKFLNELEIKEYETPINYKKELIKNNYKNIICKMNNDKRKLANDLIGRIISNIIKNPSDEKYRKINITSKVFQDSLSGEECLKFMKDIGFEMLNDGQTLKFTNGLELLDYTREIMSA